MPRPLSSKSLADQRFLFSAQSWKLDDEGYQTDPIDMEIVASTYRSIIDETAFEEMIANWSDKLDRQSDVRLGMSRQLLSQLLLARKTLETLEIPAENDPLKRAVSDIPGPAIVLSPDGRVATSNVEGELAFATHQGAFFDEAILGVESLQDFAALRRTAIDQGNAGQAILTIYPHDTDAYPTPFLAEGYTLRLPGQTGDYMVIRSLEVAWSPSVAQRLQQAFGLSKAESEVARLFFQLRNIDGIARQRGVSVLTVRTQIKAIQAKTAAPSNIDLMRLLSMVASRDLLGRRGESPVWHDPMERERQLTLSDGRRIAWTWMGAEDGTPALLLRGLTIGYLLPAQAQDRLKAAGIKLYALSRPGYGNSTLHQDLDAQADNLAALDAFLDHEIGGPCVGIGMSEGITPLLAAQGLTPSRFSALMAIGFTGALNRHAVPRLPAMQRTMLKLAGSTPWLAELIAKLGHRMMQQHGVDWYLERAYKDCPVDMKCCQDPNLAPLLRDAAGHMLTQGHVAFVRDLQLYQTNFEQGLAELDIDLHCLIPTEDGIYHAEDYDTLRALNPRIQVEPVPDAAAFLIYQQTDLVIDRIIDLVSRHRN
ncbi:alpha/beta hydrolase [Celeribacter naphthalenivorans]|uniref:alpha/beta hydrolase n=1 Tax=Celeribacter naphthalenivorans TaxID=1614694 RepID=UPI001CFB358A|nr:alpha/beta hydrolase [Celeribacter naphthalenivorans]